MLIIHTLKIFAFILKSPCIFAAHIDIVSVLNHYTNQENIEKAWIGLRAEGAESEVTWVWSNGKILRNGLLSDTQMRHANSLAANQQKKCMVVKNNYGQVTNILNINFYA